MSSAFVKEGEAGRLKDVAPALGALLFHPVNAEGKCRRTIARIGVPVAHRKHPACCGPEGLVRRFHCVQFLLMGKICLPPGQLLW